MVLLCRSVAAACKKVLLFYPQGMSYDYVSLVPGQLPAAANQKPQVAHGDVDIEEGELDDSQDCPLQKVVLYWHHRPNMHRQQQHKHKEGPSKIPLSSLNA